MLNDVIESTCNPKYGEDTFISKIKDMFRGIFYYIACLVFYLIVISIVLACFSLGGIIGGLFSIYLIFFARICD